MFTDPNLLNDSDFFFKDVWTVLTKTFLNLLTSQLKYKHTKMCSQVVYVVLAISI